MPTGGTVVVKTGALARVGGGGWPPAVLVLVAALQGLLPAGGPAVAQQGSSSPASPAPARPPLPMPGDFAPFPLGGGMLQNARQKQLQTLLRGFDAVAGVEVLIGEAGESDHLVARVLVKPRPGARLDETLVLSMVKMIEDTVQGLSRDHIFIADSGGKPLFAEGRAVPQAPPAEGNSRYVLWLVLGAVALALAAVLLTLWLNSRRRSSRDAGPFAFLAAVSDAEMDGLLAAERPDLLGVLWALGGPTVQRRLQRYAGKRGLAAKRGLAISRPLAAPDPEIAEALAMALQSKALPARDGAGWQLDAAGGRRP